MKTRGQTIVRCSAVYNCRYMWRVPRL